MTQADPFNFADFSTHIKFTLIYHKETKRSSTVFSLLFSALIFRLYNVYYYIICTLYNMYHVLNCNKRLQTKKNVQ